jgi:hypothetical protein
MPTQAEALVVNVSVQPANVAAEIAVGLEKIVDLLVRNSGDGAVVLPRDNRALMSCPWVRVLTALPLRILPHDSAVLRVSVDASSDPAAAKCLLGLRVEGEAVFMRKPSAPVDLTVSVERSLVAQTVVAMQFADDLSSISILLSSHPAAAPATPTQPVGCSCTAPTPCRHNVDNSCSAYAYTSADALASNKGSRCAAGTTECLVATPAPRTVPMAVACDALIDAPSLQLLGSGPTCVLMAAVNVSGVAGLGIVVNLGLSATIVVGQRLGFHVQMVRPSGTDQGVQKPEHLLQPEAIVQGPNVVGSCGSFSLDGSLSSGFAGRHGRFDWSIAAVEVSAHHPRNAAGWFGPL